MKGTPQKKKNADIDVSAALNRANRATEATARKQAALRPENEKTMFINFRLKESEHKKIGHMALEAGITKADFAKTATIYVMEMVDAGAFSINSGIIIDRRKI